MAQAGLTTENRERSRFRVRDQRYFAVVGESGGSIVGVALTVALVTLLLTYIVLGLAEPWAWIIPFILTFLSIVWGIRHAR